MTMQASSYDTIRSDGLNALIKCVTGPNYNDHV